LRSSALADIRAVFDLGATGDGSALEQVERELILSALRESNWVVGGTRGAAARLRLKWTGLAYKDEEVWYFAFDALTESRGGLFV
jgi:transcriptional regulator with GAF, ATPase, and Fis domain